MDNLKQLIFYYIIAHHLIEALTERNPLKKNRKTSRFKPCQHKPSNFASRKVVQQQNWLRRESVIHLLISEYLEHISNKHKTRDSDARRKGKTKVYGGIRDELI